MGFGCPILLLSICLTPDRYWVTNELVKRLSSSIRRNSISYPLVHNPRCKRSSTQLDLEYYIYFPISVTASDVGLAYEIWTIRFGAKLSESFHNVHVMMRISSVKLWFLFLNTLTCAGGAVIFYILLAIWKDRWHHDFADHVGMSKSSGKKACLIFNRTGVVRSSGVHNYCVFVLDLFYHQFGLNRPLYEECRLHHRPNGEMSWEAFIPSVTEHYRIGKICRSWWQKRGEIESTSSLIIDGRQSAPIVMPRYSTQFKSSQLCHYCWLDMK